uniref:Chlorophyll synthetase n=1 Tax=Bigelowiella natans TaxID=227086 RepID=Q7XYK8_BIGNA|nr:chlorophyll synthetase [Bigelowiella natans]|eukprot:jgi/Bigna1/55307/estExt_Genewise1Plus.C_550090
MSRARPAVVSTNSAWRMTKKPSITRSETSSRAYHRSQNQPMQAIAPPSLKKKTFSYPNVRMEPVIKGLRSEAVVQALRDPETQKWINPSKSLKFVATESLDQPLFGHSNVLKYCYRTLNSKCAAQKPGSEVTELQDLATMVCESALQDVREKAAERVPLAHKSPSSRTMVMAESDDDSDVRQLLGVRGGSKTDNIWKIRLQLMKPVTWVPLIWGVICGAAASGNYNAVWSGAPLEVCLEDLGKSLGCMVLAGPLLTGYTQTINDWYDREIDAINEPDRPIPSGAIKENEVIAQIWALLLGGLGLAYGLDQWAGHDFPMVTALSIGGSFVSYIYSAPPLKLKQSGWAGNYALGSSYIALPWWCGQAMFGTLNAPVIVLSLLYSIAGLGIAIVNDFKSIEGDRKLGLQSLPVAFGVDTAKWLCAGSIDVTQLGVAAYLYSIGETTYANILIALILPQMFFQNKYLLKDPIKYDVNYQAASQPFLVFGILDTALAMGHHQF